MNKIQNSLSACILSICASTIFFPSSVNASSFNKGSTTVAVSLGSGSFFNESYLILGAGVGYYLVDGLEASIDFDAWLGGEPDIYEVTPKLTYVFDNASHVKPYVGAFYNRTFIENRDDSNSIGYRAGFYTPAGGKAHVGIGIVYTELQDCTDTRFYSCDDTYTELSFIFNL